MTPTPTALLLLSAQRHHLTDRPDERSLSRAWLRRVEEARAAGQLVVFVQWDGEEGGEDETFSRGWTLYPDFRAEAGELLIRATQPDAFTGSDLDASLRERAVRELHFLGLPGEALRVTAGSARDFGYAVEIEEAGA